MKFVITWTPRRGGSAADVRAAQEAALERLGKFQPSASATIHQWLVRADGGGGFAVVESDTAEDILHDLSVWSDMNDNVVHPVVDIAEAAGIQARAVSSRGGG